MSDPNEQHAGETFLGERNTKKGGKYLKLSALGQKHFWYFFLLYCRETGQSPCALLVHEDGYRSLAVDTTGRRHHFWQRLHSKVALWGRRARAIPSEDAFWENGRTDSTKTLEGSIDDALLDVFQPAIEGGREASDFAIKITEDDWGMELTAERPAGVSRRYPAKVTITPMPPPELAHLGVEGARKHVKELVAAERLRTEVVPVLKHQAPRPRRVRRIRGRHAGHAEIVEAADTAYNVFKVAHGTAREAFRDGRRDAVFPAGTVYWRHVVGVRVMPRARSDDG